MSAYMLGSPRGSAGPASPGRPRDVSSSGNGSDSALSSPMAAQKQVEVLQRLSQLVAWQEKQRATVFNQQQQEIEQLQQDRYREPLQEHYYDGDPPDDRPVPSRVELARPQDQPIGAQGPDERPLQPGVDEEHITSFEELLETSLQASKTKSANVQSLQTDKKEKRQFLRRGEGIARFGMKQRRIKLTKNPLIKDSKASESSKVQLSGSQGGKAANSKATSVGCGGKGAAAAVLTCGGVPDVTIRPLVRKLARDKVCSEDETKNMTANRREVAPRESTPVMFRCSSQESFIVRRDERLEMECEELQEFEMLERAADNSFCSQFSLSLANVQPSLPFCVRQLQQSEPGQQQQQHLHSTRTSDLQSVTSQDVRSSCNQEDLLDRCSGEHVEEELPVLPGELQSHCHFTEEDSSEEGSNVDLNETLKESPSLAKGVEFDDNEAWESFSQGSNNRSLSRSDSQSSLSSSCTDAIRHPSSAAQEQDAPESVLYMDRAYSQQTSRHSPPRDSQPPPSSVLVSRLFPALRKVEEKRTVAPNVASRSVSHPPGIRGVTKAPSPVSSTGGDSGFSTGGDSGVRSVSSSSVVVSDELRQKLGQLEEEIARYRKENSNLERLRKEREESLGHLRGEIVEFKKQKEEEVAKFEEYQNEELKKLRKERRVFETYKMEAIAARSKKDKDDIENFRKELMEAREELKVREARWGATLSRYRIKIENLETENKELQSDLRMMEQERLQMWQMQIDQENRDRTAGTKKPTQVEKKIDQENRDRTAGSKKPTQVEKKSSPALLKGSSPSKSCVKRPLQDSSNQMTSSQTPTASSPKDPQTAVTKNQTKGSEEKVLRFSFSPPPQGSRQPTEDYEVPRKQGEIPSSGSKTEVSQPDGSKVITFSNGTRKIINSDGKSSSVYFFNGDVKHVKPDQTVVYYYSDFKVTQTNYPDGLEVIEFPNGQSEKHYPNGTKEIHFPNDTVKFLYASGEEECVFADGLKQHHHPNGDVTLHMPTGIKEFYSTKFKRREYPDGTTKTVYPDGKQETRYASGRIRVKDKNGKILMDSNKV